MRTLPLGSVAALAALVSLAACGEPAKPAIAPGAPVPAASSPAPSPSVADLGAAALPLPPGVPDTPAGHQLAWVIAAFAQPPDEAAVTPRFAPAFTAQVPPAQVVALFAQLGPQLSPLVIDRVEDGATPEALVVVAHAEKAAGAGAPHDGPRVRINLAVDSTDAHQITGLTLRPVVEVSSWEGVQAGLRAVGPSVGFLAAEVVGGKCVPIASIEAKKPFAIGSAFKLYVLYALGKQIASGRHGWDDPIAIEESKKSAPPGEMRSEPAGKTFTVREFAEKMISASDNTATDHLLAFVGRSAVEDAVKASGHANPARLVPFLSSRDLFAMKLLGSPDELQTYVAADLGHKRKLLEGYEQRDLPSTTSMEKSGWVKPRMIDSIEWFASPEDLCKLMASLKAQADAPKTEPIGAILAVNPGIADEKGLYKYIGFKGGSEPGVMNMTWLLQRKTDDKWVFLTVGFNDPNNSIDEQKAALAATAARDYLGK